MANTPALVTPYVTLANAETVLAGGTEWDAATDAEKNAALSYGRQFIDGRYTCEYFDEDDAPSEIQMANALFANEYLKGVLFDEADAHVVEESVKAEGVGATTKYQRGGGTSVIDPFPAISSILFGYCKLKGKGMVQLDVIRS